MLAENVRVNVFGKVGKGFFSAYVSGNSFSNKSAYLVTRKDRVEEYFDGVVIAVAKFEGLKGDKFIVAPYGEIFYRNKQNTKVLLVKNSNGRYWSFPKGHIENDENEQETALREIKEETGLDVTLAKGFREISEYCPFGKIRKRVVFFLAQAFTDSVKIQEEEIDSYIWVDLQQARKLCTYDNDLRIIEKAETAIHLMRN